MHKMVNGKKVPLTQRDLDQIEVDKARAIEKRKPTAKSQLAEGVILGKEILHKFMIYLAGQDMLSPKIKSMAGQHRDILFLLENGAIALAKEAVAEVVTVDSPLDEEDIKYLYSLFPIRDIK